MNEKHFRAIVASNEKNFTLRCISGFSNDQETIIVVFEFSVLSITFSGNIVQSQQ